jgi:hypothetical protein
MHSLSRRDFLKLSTSGLLGLGLSPMIRIPHAFDDSTQVRIATKSVSVYREPTDRSGIVHQLFRDEVVNIYEEVDGGEPIYNPIWYRVWGGFVHRGRLQKVKTLYNEPLNLIPDGTRQLSEITVPYTQAMRYTKTYGWQPNLRLYFGSVHWLTGIEKGPDGTPRRRLPANSAFYPSIHPSIWETAICLPHRMTMNYQACRGHVFFMKQAMPFMAHTGTTTLAHP